MPYVKPDIAVDTWIQAGAGKANLAIKDWLIRGFLSGAILGFATTLALTATGQTGLPIVGALIFPAGFVMIVLLGLELVTGNFATWPCRFSTVKSAGASCWRIGAGSSWAICSDRSSMRCCSA